MGKQKGSVSSNKITDYYSVASSTKRSSGINSENTKTTETSLNHISTAREAQYEEKRQKKNNERKKETSSTSSSSTGKTSSSTTTATAGSTSTRASSTSSSKPLNNITNKRKEKVAFLQSDVGKKQRKNGWEEAEITDLKKLLPHFRDGNRILWKKLMESKEYKNSSIRQNRTKDQIRSKFREMDLQGKKKEVCKRSWNEDLEKLLLEGVEQYTGHDRDTFTMILNDEKYENLHGFNKRELRNKHHNVITREGKKRNFRQEFKDDEMDSIVNGLVIYYGVEFNWAQRLLECPTYGKNLKNRKCTEITQWWHNMKNSSYKTREMFVTKYPQLQNFFYEKRIFDKIEEEFHNSDDVAKKLVDFATNKKPEFKNDLEHMTSTEVANVFFSQIIEQVPHFQDQPHQKMFNAILKDHSKPDKSTIESYVQARMPRLKEDASDELLLRTFTIYDLVHKRNVIAEAIENNTCLVLKDKENQYRVYFRVPNNLQRELCKGARTRADLGNNVHSPISSLSEQPLLIELFESTVIEVNHKYNNESDYSNNAYFKHSGGLCLKRHMYTKKHDDGFIEYLFESGAFGLSTKQVCSYRFFHIVLDNLKMSLRHTPAIENTTVGMYFFEYEEPEDAASAFCDVDHLFDRDHLYLQSFMLTTPVGHGLNSKLTDWRQKAGNWCYLLDTTKSY